MANRAKPDGSVGPTVRAKPDGNAGPLAIQSHEKDRSKGQIGVRYITEDLIKRLSGQEHLEIITTLNLHLAKEGGKIKYIENLEKLKKLKVLNLSGNAIEKIEKLDKLTNLQELNLSYNCLMKIENLEHLSGLQVLNLTGNQIQHIPLWLTKKLKGLRVFSIAKNQLESVDEVTKLQSLSNLVQLSVAGNPISELPHCKLLIIFHLRTLQMLDGQEVTSEDRRDADQRFSQEEVERLRIQLEKLDLENHQLMELNNQSMENESDLVQRQQALEEERQMLEQGLKEKEQELQTTVQLLQKKTSDLTRTSMKQYELEQELAFYKIDHKFDSLSHPHPETPESMSMEEGSPGESPYIGKGRFRPNEMAHEEFIHLKPVIAKQGQVSGWPKGVGAASDHTAAQSSYMERFAGMASEQSKAMESMNRELEEKQKAIRSAEDQLQRLQSELERAELDLGRATKEQQRLQSADNGKEIVKESLTEKLKHMSRLQKEAESIEAAMRAAREEIYDQESEIKQFYSHLKQMNAADSPNYSSLEKEAGTREEQLNQAQLRYKHLQNRLEQRLAAMTKEAEDVKRLEQELRRGHVIPNEELKHELDSIIRGLSSYLHGVRQTSDAQNLELAGLMHDRSELLQKLKDLEQERQVILKKANRETAYLKQQLADMEESIRERQSINESLQRQLNESQTRDAVESGANSGRLQEASTMIKELKRKIAALQSEKQAEKENFEKRLQLDGKRMSQMRQKVREADVKDNENRNLHRELSELQAANVRLQDQLYAAQEKLQQQKQNSVDPEALRRRLEEVTKAIKASKGMGRTEKAPSRKADDPLEQMIGNLEENVHREMEKKSLELDVVHRAKEKMESKLLEMRDEIIQVQEHDRSMAEQAIQAAVENEKRDQENLLAEIQRLQEELAKERANHEKGPTKGHRERKSTSQSTTTSGSGSGSSTGTTVMGTSSTGKTSSSGTNAGSSSSSSSTSLSVWSAKKREIYNTMTNDEKALFDELQKEIEELRNLLAANDKRATSKAEDAREKTDRLKEMIDRRYRSVGVSVAGSYSSSSQQSASSVTSESEDLQKAIHELDDVQSEMEALRERLIKESRGRGRPHGSHQDERSQLYEILDDQRKEINRLSQALDDEIRQKNYVASQIPAASHPMVSNIQQPLVSRLPMDAYPGSPLQQPPVHFGSSFNPYSHMEPQGTSGPPIQLAANSGFVPKDDGGMYPSGAHPYQYPSASSEPRPIGYPPGASFVPGPPTAGAVGSYGHPLVSGVGQTVGIHPQALAPSGISQPLPPYGFPANQPPQPSAFAAPTQRVTYPTGQLGLAPTTLAAGAGFAQPYILAPMPAAATGQPLMMNTPSTLPDRAPLESPTRKSIPTNSDQYDGAGEERTGTWFCNVPEHHDLEDHISKLQHKIRSLQNRLREEAEEPSFREKASRRVAFEDDCRVNRVAVLRLQSELEDRRVELEGLDLAIERQKAFVKEMKQQENSILAKREAIKTEFESLRRGRAERRNFQSFLEATSPIPDVPEYDYDFDMTEFGSQKNYLISELKCAENTLSKRRSELTEIEHHLAQCKADLTDAQNELKAIKSELHLTIEAQKEIEHCTHDTGILLLDAESKVKETQSEVEQLEEQKNQLKAIVKDIEDVIRAKDEEFQILELKIKQATHCLETLQKDSVDDSNISVTKEQEVLDLINQELLAKQQDLEALLIEFRKQQSLLDLVNAQVDGDLDSRRKEVQMLDKQLETLRSEKHDISDEIEAKENHLQSLLQELERLRSENHKRMSELERQRQLKDQEKKEYELFETDKRNLENVLDRLKWEKSLLVEEEKKLSTRIADLNKIQEETHGAVQDQQQKLVKLNAELTKIEEAFDNVKQRRSILNGELNGLRSQIKDGHSELIEINSHLRNTEECINGLTEQEAERRHINEAGFSSLEDRVRNLGKEISNRDKEIEQLRLTLTQVKQDYEHKQKLLAAEMEALQEKSAKRMSDLEAAARAQYARANRLVDEMSYQRAEYLEVKRQLDTRKELAEREANLVDALTSFKSDLQFGVTENILDLERARKSMMAEEEKTLSKTKENLEYYINNLRESLNLDVIRAQNASSSVSESTGLNLPSELEVLKAKQDSIKKANLGNIEQLQKKHSWNEEKLTELERIMRQAEEISRQTDSAKLAQLQATRTNTDNPGSHPPSGDYEASATDK